MIDNSVFYFNNQSVNGNFNIDGLNTTINQSNIQASLVTILKMEDKIVCVFEQNITQQDKDILDSIISTHNHIDLKTYTETLIRNAINFAQEQMVVFAAENVAMGITGQGKTKEVADFLSDVTRYAQTGSLYEIVNEINRLISEGLPSNLEPFVTEARLNEMKSKIFQYLGI